MRLVLGSRGVFIDQQKVKDVNDLSFHVDFSKIEAEDTKYNEDSVHQSSDVSKNPKEIHVQPPKVLTMVENPEVKDHQRMFAVVRIIVSRVFDHPRFSNVDVLFALFRSKL
jgi:hypothetical protein